MKQCKCCKKCFKDGMVHVLNVIERARKRELVLDLKIAAIEAKRKGFLK